MNPADIRFKAVEASAKGYKACKQCMFAGEGFRGCKTASDLAVQRGMPDCDDTAPSGKTYIYVLDETDPRQMDLLQKET